MSSIVSKQITRENLVLNVRELLRLAICDNDIGLLLEVIKLIYDARIEKLIVGQHRFIHDRLDALGFDALHNALDA